jgi:hypothetical protein
VDNFFVTLNVTDEQRHGAKLLMAIMMVGVGFGLNGKKQQRYRNNSFPHRGRTP